MCADSRRGQRVLGVDGDGVSGAAGILRVGDHGRKLEGVGAGAVHGHADVARRVADHPGHLLGCDIFGGDDEITFVFARGVVEDEEELAALCKTDIVSNNTCAEYSWACKLDAALSVACDASSQRPLGVPVTGYLLNASIESGMESN